jgi:gliding motility-associated lipoprotein GldB
MKKKTNFAQSIKMMATPNKTKQIYLFFFISLLLTACSHSKKVDVSNIDVNITVERFDKDFDAIRTKPTAQEAAILQNKYGVFYKDFIEQILQAGTITDTAYYNVIRQIVNAQPYKDLEHDVDSVYPNMDKQNAELTDAFRRVKYYYPQQRIPKIYAYFSGFEAQTSIGDGYFGIGLDLFLGANSRFYPSLTKAFPHYLSQFFTPDNITPRVIEGFARNEMFPEKDVDQSLLTKMIYNGKILYFMDQVLPDVPDSTKIGYTAKQLDWCKKYEPSIWGYLLDENLLYETDYNKIKKFIDVAPFTSGIGENNEAAPRLGLYEGWQIVKSYMDKHPDITLPQLMANTDPQQILTDSKYHPK